MTDILPLQHKWPVRLRWGALVLRELRRSDQAVWRQVRTHNSAWLREWDATSPPEGPRQEQSFAGFVAAQRKEAKAGTSIAMALAWDDGFPEDPCPDHRATLIGQVTLFNIVYGSGRFASIGYWIDQGFAGQGLVPAAVALMADYAWQVLRLHRVEIAVRPENDRSLAVVRKLGFRYEGERPAYLHINGRWCDHKVFALNCDEVPAGLFAQWVAEHPTLPGGAGEAWQETTLQ